MKHFSKTTLLTILLIVFFSAAGFFIVQWWQVKGKLGKQIERNENLTKQIDELQKEIEELKSPKEIIADETTGWKTYKNEEYGFEIDYPVDDWEFREGGIGGAICKISVPEMQKDKEEFCISINRDLLYHECVGYSWEEIFASGEYTKPFPGGEDCIFGYNKGGEFEKEIITDFGVKGYKGRIILSFGPLFGPPSELKSGDECNSKIVVYFPLKGEVKLNGRSYFPLLAISYIDCPSFIDYSEREIKIFERIFSTVRFVERYSLF